MWPQVPGCLTSSPGEPCEPLKGPRRLKVFSRLLWVCTSSREEKLLTRGPLGTFGVALSPHLSQTRENRALPCPRTSSGQREAGPGAHRVGCGALT